MLVVLVAKGSRARLGNTEGQNEGPTSRLSPHRALSLLGFSSVPVYLFGPRLGDSALAGRVSRPPRWPGHVPMSLLGLPGSAVASELGTGPSPRGGTVLFTVSPCVLSSLGSNWPSALPACPNEPSPPPRRLCAWRAALPATANYGPQITRRPRPLCTHSGRRCFVPIVPSKVQRGFS